MIKSKSIKKNYVYNLSYRMLALLIPLITTPYISRILGASGVGTYSYTTAIVSYFVLAANFGSNYYGSREVAYFRDDIAARSRVFWEVILFRAVTTALCLCVYLLFIWDSRYRNIFLSQSIAIVAVFFDVSWFFSGIEEFGITVLRNIIIKIASVIFIFTVVKDADDILLYVLGMTGAALLGDMSFWFHIPKYVKKIPFADIKPFRNIKVIIQLFIPYVATQIYTVLDKTMIGYFSTTSVENGYYEQAEKIVKILLTVITAMGTVMVPRFAYLYKGQRWDEITDYIKRGFSFVWCIAIPMCLGLILISDSFVPWFFGREFSSVSSLLRIFSLLTIAIGVSNLLGTQYLIPTGRQNHYTVTVILGAVVNAILNFILIPKHFSVGAAIASVSAESAIMAAQIIILRKEIPLKIMLGSCKNYLLAGIVMFVVAFPLSNRIPATIPGTILLVMIGCIIYGVVLLVMKDSFVWGYAAKFYRKIRRR